VVFEVGGGDGTDGQGGHDQNEMAADRGVQPGLALVQAEVVLGELESFLDGPSQRVLCGFFASLLCERVWLLLLVSRLWGREGEKAW
jgi:hypothetical protein